MVGFESVPARVWHEAYDSFLEGDSEPLITLAFFVESLPSLFPDPVSLSSGSSGEEIILFWKRFCVFQESMLSSAEDSVPYSESHQLTPELSPKDPQLCTQLPSPLCPGLATSAEALGQESDPLDSSLSSVLDTDLTSLLSQE